MLRNIIWFSLIILLFSFNAARAQRVIVPPLLKLPADSLQNKRLINSLNEFLKLAGKPAKDNAFVDKEYLAETAIIADEIKGMENAGPDKKGFYKCYLSSISPIDSNESFVQFAYMGGDAQMPLLRAGFRLIARKAGDEYHFYAPLKRNTANWKKKTEGNFIFYLKTNLKPTLTANYVKKAREFDKKLNAPGYITEIYFCDNAQEALETFGITYKADYSSYSNLGFSSFENNTELMIFGNNVADPTILDIHDCWHNRLHRAVNPDIINRPVDEGCAYLYGGSWGYTWPFIFKKFVAFMGTGKDWLKTFTENKNFGENQQRHLYPAYVINALLAQKIENEKGFAGVIEFVTCGKREPSNENYFRAVNKLTGITQANFNERIEKLIESEKAKW